MSKAVMCGPVLILIYHSRIHVQTILYIKRLVVFCCYSKCFVGNSSIIAHVKANCIFNAVVGKKKYLSYTAPVQMCVYCAISLVTSN